jgi:uncharacterized membrane protein YccC
MLRLPRIVSLAIFRIHIENGLSVAFGVGLVGVCIGLAMQGVAPAVTAATGALCVSISDQPDPLRQKPRVLALALLVSCLFTALCVFAGLFPAALLAATLFAGLATGLISSFGKRALSLAMSTILAFIFSVGVPFADMHALYEHLFLFSTGALGYAAYALAIAYIFDDRVRRLLLAEAMRSFATYLRAKAHLYDPNAEGHGALRALIDAHTALAERLQDARNALYARQEGPRSLRRIDTLIALLDAFETMLSSDADLETLRRARHHHLMRRLSALTNAIADDVESLTLALRSADSRTQKRDLGERHAQIAAEIERLDAAGKGDGPAQVVAAFRSTADKLSHADMHVARLAEALDGRNPPSSLARGLDLSAFRQHPPHFAYHLARQFSLGSPALRYAIRLSLALGMGLLLTMVFPEIAHGNWVLLTTALIMRANYSVTRQRRKDRITGTLLGCVLAVIFIDILPQYVLLTGVVLGVGVSHAYGGVKYRITAISASITALLLLHFETPIAHQPVFARISDTLIGAGLSYVFSFLLPNWERNDLPRIVRDLLAADAAYAKEALVGKRVQYSYRLMRKRALDAVATLSAAARRLAGEPGTNRRLLAALGALLSANYLLVSDLSSMPVLMRLRKDDLDPAAAEALIAKARGRVTALLTSPAIAVPEDKALPRHGLSGLQLRTGMGILARRLVHIENAARKVARLATRI